MFPFHRAPIPSAAAIAPGRDEPKTGRRVTSGRERKQQRPRNPTRPRSIFTTKVKKNFRCEMKRLAIVLSLAGACALSGGIGAPAFALETPEAKAEATDAASQAMFDMFEAFGFKHLKAGQYLWRDIP